MINDIVTVDISRHYPFEQSPAKVLVGLGHAKFLNRLIELGEDFLEENKIFCILFDTTPQDRIISDMKSYKEIADAFPKSSRIADHALYIGNYAEKDWESIVNQCLSGWFGDYEIVELLK